MVARRANTGHHRQRISHGALLLCVGLVTLSGCAARSPYPLLANAGPLHGVSIDEAERLAGVLERQRGFVPELDGVVVHLAKTARPTDVTAYRLLAAAESHLLTATLVDVMAARIHEHAARAALRNLYDTTGGAERMGFARLQSVSKRLTLASLQLRMQAKSEREKGLDLSRTASLQSATSTLEIALIVERAIATGNWNAFDLAMAALTRADTNGPLSAFYRAINALERRGDLSAASRHLAEALGEDQSFGRARAALVLLQPSIPLALAELSELARLQPKHRWSTIAVASK